MGRKMIFLLMLGEGSASEMNLGMKSLKSRDRITLYIKLPDPQGSLKRKHKSDALRQDSTVV